MSYTFQEVDLIREELQKLISLRIWSCVLPVSFFFNYLLISISLRGRLLLISTYLYLLAIECISMTHVVKALLKLKLFEMLTRGHHRLYLSRYVPIMLSFSIRSLVELFALFQCLRHMAFVR